MTLVISPDRSKIYYSPLFGSLFHRHRNRKWLLDTYFRPICVEPFCCVDCSFWGSTECSEWKCVFVTHAHARAQTHTHEQQQWGIMLAEGCQVRSRYIMMVNLSLHRGAHLWFITFPSNVMLYSGPGPQTPKSNNTQTSREYSFKQQSQYLNTGSDQRWDS